MPKLTENRVPAYRRHKQSGQAIVTLNGKDHLLGPYGTAASHREYDRLIAEWMAAGRQLPRAHTDLSIAELCQAFRQHAKTFYKGRDGKLSREYFEYKVALRRLRQMYGAIPAVEFGPLKLQAFRATLPKPWTAKDAHTGELVNHPGWSRVTVNDRIRQVKAVFRWATEQELLPPAVYAALAAVKGLQAGKSDARETQPVKPVHESHIDACRPFLSPQVRAMVDLQLLTGMRPGEVCAMRTGDIDTTGRLWIYTPEHHKTEHHGFKRSVYLGPRAQQVLQPFLKTDLVAPIFSPAEAAQWAREQRRAARKTPLNQGNRPGTNLARTPKRRPGNRYDVAGYRRAIARAADRADALARQQAVAAGHPVKEGERIVPRWHPHQLRHNAATLLRKNFGVEAAGVILGHQNVRVTELYAEQNVETAMKIMAQVG